MSAGSNSFTLSGQSSASGRMGTAVSAPETPAVSSDERAQQILAERARALAIPADDDARVHDTMSAVMFRLSHERYAIETRYVREVVSLRSVTPLPRTADFVAGIIFLRGDFIPVFDLLSVLGIAADGSIAPSHILILGETRAEFGIAVCGLPQAVSISLGEIAVISGEGMSENRSFLRGVTRDSLIVIDGFRLMSDRRLFLEKAE
jgi:purine-binding chemotaxis protein CheW